MTGTAFDPSLLRQDLQLIEPPDVDDNTILIGDPVRYRFFRLARSQFVETEKAESLKEFAARNELVAQTAPNSGRALAESARRHKRDLFTKALHGYLYFRIPLIYPEPLLHRLWPLVAMLATRAFLILTVVVALIGLFLASRKMDELAASAASVFALGQLLPFMAGYGLIKVLHELGHAFAAWRYKIPVPSAGIAVMLFTPVLYTETSAAWQLPRQKRLVIGAAGMLVELAVAAWALLLWAFVEDGVLRAILFATATTGWIMTLAVNLNPLMRFDGYFLLSDLTGIENLQDRSFALARWQMRETLLGLGEPKPEPWDSARTAGLIAFAWATWVYRFFLYLGIAVLVYHFAIKIAGIALFAVEIWWFIALPLWREGRLWWSKRETWLKTRRAAHTGLFCVLAVLLAVLPLDRSVTLPALLVSEREADIHVTMDALILTSDIAENRAVAKGDVLAEMDIPDLEGRVMQAQARLRLANANLARLTADAQSRSNRAILEQQRAKAEQELAALKEISHTATLTAPFDGILVNVDPDLHKGRWIGTRDRLAVLISPLQAKAISFADDITMPRLSNGAKGRFIPEDRAYEPIPVELVQLAASAGKSLSITELADVNGGTIVTAPASKGPLVALRRQTRLEFKPRTAQAAPRQTLRGVVFVDAHAESLASRALRRAAKVLIEETAF